jgi:hypothetical protein
VIDSKCFPVIYLDRNASVMRASKQMETRSKYFSIQVAATPTDEVWRKQAWHISEAVSCRNFSGRAEENNRSDGKKRAAAPAETRTE